ncbi:hypothetical protein U1Q18_033374 [Sarracenia purpurea var. burkii]
MLSKSPRIGEIEGTNLSRKGIYSEYTGKGRLPPVRGLGAIESGKEKRFTAEQGSQWLANLIENFGENRKQIATSLPRGFRNFRSGFAPIA